MHFKLSDTKYVSLDKDIPPDLEILQFQKLRSSISPNTVVQMMGYHAVTVFYTSDSNKFIVMELGPIGQKQLRDRNLEAPEALPSDNNARSCQSNFLKTKTHGIGFTLFSIDLVRFLQYLGEHEGGNFHIEAEERKSVARKTYCSSIIELIRDSDAQYYWMLQHNLILRNHLGHLRANVTNCILFADEVSEKLE